MERSTIHLLHKRGKSQREIARELGQVVPPWPERWRAGRSSAATTTRSKLTDPYRERIAGWVKDGLTAVRMFELARDDPERPYPGQLSAFRGAVRRGGTRRPRARRSPRSVRFEGLPGEYLQVDWARSASSRSPSRSPRRATSWRVD